METADAVESLSALAQTSRLAVFRLLVRAGPDGLPAGEIARRLEIQSATLSFHLSQLDRAGLVCSERRGRSIVYSANYDAMNALLSYLRENCCQGPTSGAAR